MDPTENLRQQLEIAKRIQERMERYADCGDGSLLLQNADDAERLAELVEALDDWIRGAGFLPEPWQGNDADEGACPECIRSHGPHFKGPCKH